MAQTPPKQMTHFEQLRANRVARAALETPLVNGLRLMPQYTPGRALLWGSIIALWGSGAIFMTAAKGLDIHAVRPFCQEHVLHAALQIYCGSDLCCALHLPKAMRRHMHPRQSECCWLPSRPDVMTSAMMCRLRRRNQSLRPLPGP